MKSILEGAKGVISITTNVAPKLMAHMCDAARAGEVEKAQEIDSKLQPLHTAMFAETNPIPVKWALQQMDLIPEGIRLPLTPLSESCHMQVRDAMKVAGILV